MTIDVNATFSTVLVKVSIVGIKHHGQKKFGEEKVYFDLQLETIIKEVRAGTQGGNPEAGTEAEDREEHCSLACSPWLAQPAFSSLSRITFSELSTVYNKLDPLTSIINQENVPQICL